MRSHSQPPPRFGVHGGPRRELALQPAQPRSAMPKDSSGTKRQRTHTGSGAQAQRHACPHCARTFGQQGTRNRHVRTVHKKRRDFGCPHCAAAFGQASHRACHMHTQHPNDNGQAAECPICLELLAGVADYATTSCGRRFYLARIEEIVCPAARCWHCGSMRNCNGASSSSSNSSSSSSSKTKGQRQW